MRRFIRNILVVGGVSSVTTTLAVLLGGRRDVGKATSPLNAVSHIAWGGRPPSHGGKAAINTWAGLALHIGACLFWASAFETALGRMARRDVARAALGGAITAGVAYVTDYHIVSQRFRPGYEAYLSGRSMFSVYATFAAGIAIGAALTRLDDH